jgi:hypothetical protein
VWNAGTSRKKSSEPHCAIFAKGFEYIARENCDVIRSGAKDLTIEVSVAAVQIA